MGWAVGWDSLTGRFRGYGVVAYCEHPDCNRVIDRGLGRACMAHGNGLDEEDPDDYCGRFYCGDHYRDEDEPPPLKPEHQRWLRHVLIDASWKKWRKENPQRVERYHKDLAEFYGLTADADRSEP